MRALGYTLCIEQSTREIAISTCSVSRYEGESARERERGFHAFCLFSLRKSSTRLVGYLSRYFLIKSYCIYMTMVSLWNFFYL